MTSLMSAVTCEYRKIVTWRAWWYLVGVVVLVLAGLSATISDIALSSSPFGVGASDASSASVLYSAPTMVGPVVAIAIGILVATRDYRNSTAGLTFLGEPRRDRVLSSKLLVTVGASLFTAALGLVVSAGIALAYLLAADERLWLATPEVQEKFGGTLIAFALWSLFGLGIGALVRNQFGALLAACGYLLVIEPALRMLLGLGGARLVDFFPGVAGDALVGGSPISGMYPNTLQDPMHGGFVLAAYTLVTLALGWVRTITSDVS